MSRHNDEFNVEKITNEGVDTFEFGGTQDGEYTSFSDNHDPLRDEVNDNPQVNDDHSPREKERKKEESKKEESKQPNSSSSSSGGGVGGSAATSIATVVGASLVTVGSLSALVGINIFVQAKCKVNKMDLTPVSLNYELELEDVGSNEQFVIQMANNDLNYNQSNELQAGSNEGYFVDLTPSSEYEVSVYKIGLVEYPIYTEVVVTPAEGDNPDTPVKEQVTISFDADGREGRMGSIEAKNNDKFEVPVSIFVPNYDEIFGGWIIKGTDQKVQPGEIIDLTDDTVLVASWDKLPTTPTTTTGNRYLFQYFPTEPSSEIRVVSDIMDIDFNIQNVYYAESAACLNFTSEGGFVSTTRPFGGTLSEIEITTSSDQGSSVNYTVVFSSRPIYEKTTESGETHEISAGSSYTFNCSNPDARYFCLSTGENSIEPSIATIKFVYNVPDKSDLSFTVTIEPNGGIGSSIVRTITDNNGQLPTASYVGFEPQEGYEFAGWKVKGVNDLLEAGTTIGLSSDITLLAQWKELPPSSQYTVNFDMNGGSTDYPLEPITVDPNETISLPTSETLEVVMGPSEIYLFNGWSETPDGSRVSYDYQVTKDVTLYARWRKNGFAFSEYFQSFPSEGSDSTETLNFSSVGTVYSNGCYYFMSAMFKVGYNTNGSYIANGTGIDLGIKSIIIQAAEPITISVTFFEDAPMNEHHFDGASAHEFVCAGDQSEKFEFESDNGAMFFNISVEEGGSEAMINDILVVYNNV